MLGVLIKKQVKQVLSFYLNKRSGERRSKGGIIGFAVLFGFLFVYLGFAFAMMEYGLCPALCGAGYGWAYYAIVYIIALAFGILGSVFNTYQTLYFAKDNDMLLSMPIEPFKIIVSRVFGVAVMSTIFTGVVTLPGFIVRLIFAPVTVTSVIFSFLMIFIVVLLVTALTSLFGFLVALIASKTKNNSAMIVVFALLLMVGYFLVIYKSGDFFDALLVDPSLVETSLKVWAYPLYAMGLAAEGNVIALIATVAATLLLFLLAIWVLSKTFTGIATKTATASTKGEYKADDNKAQSVEKALFKKEFKRYLASPVYMLNCTLGTLVMFVLAILALVFSGRVRDALISAGPEIENIKPILALGAIMFLSTMNMLTAPSISLEGKNIWILQSLPVDTRKVLDTKQRLHYILTMPFVLLLGVCASVAFALTFENAIMVIVCSLAFVMFDSAFGLMLNILSPNLDWANEAIPVKQSVATFATMFGCGLIALALSVGAFFLVRITSPFVAMAIATAVIVLATRFINGYIRTKGAEKFSNL